MDITREVVENVVELVVTFSVIVTVTVSLVFHSPESVAMTVSVVVTFSVTMTVSVVTSSVTVTVSEAVTGVHSSMAEDDSKDVLESSVIKTKLPFEDSNSFCVHSCSMEYSLVNMRIRYMVTTKTAARRTTCFLFTVLKCKKRNGLKQVSLANCRVMFLLILTVNSKSNITK